MTNEEEMQKYMSWFDEINLIDCEEDSWGFSSDSENKNTMEQNDVLSTQANTSGGFEYAAHPANLNSSAANCSYAGEIIPDYTSNGSVITTPMSTDCNVITDTYQYTPSFLTPTNFYGSNTLSSEHYQKLNPDNVQYEQRTNYENFATTEISASEPMDTCQPLSNSQITNNPVPYDSVVKEEHEDTTNNKFNNFQSSSTGSLTDAENDFEKSACVDGSEQSVPNCISSNVPHSTNNYSESSSNVTSYAEPSEGIKMETTIETVDNDYVPDTTLNANPSVPEAKAADCIAVDSVKEEIKIEEIKQEASVDIVDVKNESNESQIVNQVPETPHENETKSLTNANKFTTEMKNVQMCIRNGCINCAVNNPEWEQEFCSNDCVILHCRNVFMAWVKANKIAS